MAGAKRVLITGAAGFVGSHTVDLLVARGGWEIVALDSLDPQVHGENAAPRFLESHIASGAVRFVRADVRDRAVMGPLVADCDAILHLAAAVGVGQSMYQPHHYCDVNIGGTATLMDLLLAAPHRVRKMVVASSMSIYGEGAYRCARCNEGVTVAERPEAQLRERRWEHLCPRCGTELTTLNTPETKTLQSTSVYAITKKVQEELLLVFGRAYRIPVVALRYFNIYGPRQSLSNPYTGVAAIFLGRLMNGNAPTVFEDGLQSRDFIHVRDIARANVTALEAELPADNAQRVYNVGTGERTSVLDVANTLERGLGTSLGATVTHKFRAGDIRHCIADASLIQRELGFRAAVSREEGFRELIDWSRGEKPVDTFRSSMDELARHKLVS